MSEALTLLVVEDDAHLREALADTLALAGYNVRVAADAETALLLLARMTPGLVLSDVQMPGMDGHALLRAIKSVQPETPVLLMTAYGQIEKAVEAMREGASDYIPKPFEPDVLLAAIARYFRRADLTETAGLIAEDPLTLNLVSLARRVAASNTSVLLSGESGVGKEVFARFIHQHSARRQGPFVAVNCAAIPENLLESVLFGHEKGAFTGAASTQPGKFEQANSGVLLLDEISELPLNLQAKLLRVLQEREVERVGGRSPVSLDVRVIAATNRDLGQWTREGRFREDLYYRLNVFPLEIPALRQRRGDILPMARSFLLRFEDLVDRRGFSLSERAAAALVMHDWPGNIRELANVMQRAMVLAPTPVIEAEHLLLPERAGAIAARPAASDSNASRPSGSTEKSGKALKDVERDTILETLERMRGSRKLTAEALDMSERTLRHKLKQYREAGFLPEDNDL